MATPPFQVQDPKPYAPSPRALSCAEALMTQDWAMVKMVMENRATLFGSDVNTELRGHVAANILDARFPHYDAILTILKALVGERNVVVHCPDALLDEARAVLAQVEEAAKEAR